MSSDPVARTVTQPSVLDASLLARAQAGDSHAIRDMTSRCNQRLFRVALAILNDHSDAEEVVQDTYMRVLRPQTQFFGQSTFATWITRIAIRVAIERKRAKALRSQLLAKNRIAELSDHRSRFLEAPMSTAGPEDAFARTELARQIEAAIVQLPEPLRTMFVLRDVEGCTIEETSEILDLPPATVKTRLLRARRLLREILKPELQAALQDSFPFGGQDCARMTENILLQITQTSGE